MGRLRLHVLTEALVKTWPFSKWHTARNIEASIKPKGMPCCFIGEVEWTWWLLHEVQVQLQVANIMGFLLWKMQETLIGLLNLPCITCISINWHITSVFWQSLLVAEVYFLIRLNFFRCPLFRTFLSVILESLRFYVNWDYLHGRWVQTL